VITCAIRQQFVKERKVFDLKGVNEDQKFNAANGDEAKGRSKLKRSFGKNLICFHSCRQKYKSSWLKLLRQDDSETRTT